MFNKKRNIIIITTIILLTLSIGIYTFSQNIDKKQSYLNMKSAWDKEKQTLLHMSGKAKTDAEIKELQERSIAIKQQSKELAKLKQEVDPPNPQELFEQDLKVELACIGINRSMLKSGFSKEDLDQKEQKIKQLDLDYKGGKKTIEEAQKELNEIKKLPIKK